jgi:hypothetical protein
MELKRRSVFLNVPFDRSYERLFVALIAALVALGRAPRCVLELPEIGEGRLSRILRLMQSCGLSIHDLSRVGRPARFNMPFELGIAVALNRIRRGHEFILLEAEQHRLSRTLSDLGGIDPGIHGRTVSGVISCVISHLGQPRGNPSLEHVKSLWRDLQRIVPVLKRRHGSGTIYSRAIFHELLDAATLLAAEANFIRP